MDFKLDFEKRRKMSYWFRKQKFKGKGSCFNIIRFGEGYILIVFKFELDYYISFENGVENILEICMFVFWFFCFW